MSVKRRQRSSTKLFLRSMGYYFKTIRENLLRIRVRVIRIFDNTEMKLEWNTYRTLVNYFHPSEMHF